MKKRLAASFVVLCSFVAVQELKSSSAGDGQASVANSSAGETVRVDLSAPSTPFPHFWEQMFGSGRANLTLRDSYRRDLDWVRDITGFRYVRFHAIFHDENGVYDEDAQGNPVYNFSYVDQIYDGLLAHGVRPFVELSFMPKKLAANPVLHAFWYKPSPSPPKEYAKWDALITAFAQHLVSRYGIDEVSQWYFEVWNEPNIDFWAGEPKQATYFELYDHSARALKAVSPRLRVGGPATAQAAWAPAFIQHVAQANVPADFFSTHVYANDRAIDVFGTNENIPRDQMVCRAVKHVHEQIRASARPNLPLIWSEYNASYMNEPEITDTEFMGPWLADTIRQCDGSVDVMSYWTFSDVFEEQGVVKQPFYGGFGLVAEYGLPKPAFNAFKILHRLGDRRLPVSSNSALVTVKSGAPVIAAWNLVLPGATGSPKSLTFQFSGLSGTHTATIYRVDSSHGSLLNAYKQIGSPRNPSRQQIDALRRAAALPAPEQVPISGNQLNLNLPQQSLAVIEIK
ncbi:MAG: glycosyl hydrolase family 39 [Acidobacteria bacterium]|nr:glycosyl hydrolase family 39 [Acidobacteriota bacterium]MBV9437553.1 glycosyl hydrolase family 39 [Acidobacteriota bacterium]